MDQEWPESVLSEREKVLDHTMRVGHRSNYIILLCLHTLAELHSIHVQTQTVCAPVMVKDAANSLNETINIGQPIENMYMF